MTRGARHRDAPFAARRTCTLPATAASTVHRDYWDAAEELYEKLPLLGALMRWLKRRVNA